MIHSPDLAELKMVGITKRFPGVLANDNVYFSVKAGEIHALLGENGAGKSTLMNQLYGLYQPDEGEILINGAKMSFQSPVDSMRAGIGMVHQHFMLVPKLTVLENIALGLKSKRGPFLDLDEVADRCAELSQQYGLKINPDAYVWQLSVGEQQRVEILKVLYRGASLFVMDEPTAVLIPQEVSDLFNTLRTLVDEGHSIIFISHKLQEVLDISERVTVLRDGHSLGTFQTRGMTKRKLAKLMVGREVVLEYEKQQIEAKNQRLIVENLSVEGDKGNLAVKDISFDLRGGEVLAIAGVSGSGQRELAEALSGLRSTAEGKAMLDGEIISNTSPSKAIAAGLAYIPEARMRHGVVKDFTVAENFMLRDFNKYPFASRIVTNPKAINEHSEKFVNSYSIKTPSVATPVKNLSGGNIQKIILARELSRDPSVVIAAQPTRGVDISASEYIHQKILELRAAGIATLLISEDLEEIFALSDRIAVMYDGKIIGIVDTPKATIEQIGLMMAGEIL